MRRALALAFTISTLFASQASLADDDAERARKLVHERYILPLETILERNAKLLSGKIIELELESEGRHKHGRVYYHLRLLRPNGRVDRFKIDARTGEPISKKHNE
ncbi:MAG: hypothetical protein R3D67_01865 [Hyphomicrobiaceae bacterium]